MTEDAKEKKLINYEPYSFITRTREGTRIAKAITRRHKALKDFFLKVLQLDEKTAEETACKMEHAVDDVTYERLVSFIEYLFKCPCCDHHKRKFSVNLDNGY